VLRLHASLLLSMPAAELLDALGRMARGNTTTIRQIVNAVDALITAAAYR
jgi:hypothetical protein